MKIRRNNQLLSNKVFLLSLLILSLNDHVWKAQYGNWITGKLSDFAGLVVLPLLLAYLFTKWKQYTAIAAGLFFIFWKSPFSEMPISWYNQVSFIPITRVVDYTDLLALCILPIAHFLIMRLDDWPQLHLKLIRLHPFVILVPCCFALMATSPPRSYYLPQGEGIGIHKYYKVKMSETKMLERLREEGFKVIPDSPADQDYRKMYTNYKIENVVFPGEKDTIDCIYFSVFNWTDKEETEVCVNRIYVKNIEGLLSDRKKWRRYYRHYRKLLKSGLINEIRKK